MKSANEIKAMAMKAIEIERKAKEEKAIAYVEEYYIYHIERAAKMGKFEVCVGIDHYIDEECVANYLARHNFKVEVKNHVVRINWEN